jgi:hypothetical protein
MQSQWEYDGQITRIRTMIKKRTGEFEQYMLGRNNAVKLAKPPNGFNQPRDND